MAADPPRIRRAASRPARRALMVLLLVAVAVWVLVPWWLTRNDFTRVPQATSLRDVASELAALEQAGFTLEQANGHDPDGDHFSEYAYASWSLPASVASVSVSFSLDTGPTPGGRQGFQSGASVVSRDLADLERDREAVGYQTAQNGLGDEGFEQVGASPIANDPSRMVRQAVRVRNVLILVEYLAQNGGDVEEMRRVARGIASAAVDRLQAVNADT